MRGIISAAMMVALKDEGLESAFDEIYAVSAGAVNSVYFLSGYGWHGLSIYYDDLISREFFDWRRALHRQAMLSLRSIMCRRRCHADTEATQNRCRDSLTNPAPYLRLMVDTVTSRDFSHFQSGETEYDHKGKHLLATDCRATDRN